MGPPRSGSGVRAQRMSGTVGLWYEGGVDQERWLEEQLREREAAGLLRDPAQERWGLGLTEEWLNACSNDYLGLAHRHVSRETLLAVAAPERQGGGASRLIYGGADAHLELETALAAWVGLPEALLFSSGYAANVGVLSALGDRDTLIVSDALNHASIIDGCRLSGAELRVTPHLDLAAVQAALQHPAKRKLVVVESYYSMDGDGPELPALRRLCDAAGAALVLDEAHALGVFGPRGAGRAAAAGVQPDVLIGTLGKALGLHGAFAAGSARLRTWLWNRARSFVFSTAPPPWLARLALNAVHQVQADDAARQALHAHAAALRAALPPAWRAADRSQGPVLPLLLGDSELALRLSRTLATREQLLVQAIRYPTVPAGTARLRLTLRADYSVEDVARLARALRRHLPPHPPA